MTANAVGIIDPKSNEVVGQIPVGIRPGSLAVGSGSVWVGNEQDRTLTRIDAGKRAVSSTFPLGSTPTGVATGDELGLGRRRGASGTSSASARR